MNLFYNWTQFQLKTFTILSIVKRELKKEKIMKKTRNWQVRSCFQCPVHSLCPPLSISSPPAIVSTLFDVGFEGRKKCPFLKYKDLLAIGRVGSQKVPLYVCFLMKIQMVKFCQKAKRDKSIPLTPPVPNKVSEGGILITQKIQDLSGFNFKVQCPCLGKTCWSILDNAVGFLKIDFRPCFQFSFSLIASSFF